MVSATEAAVAGGCEIAGVNRCHLQFLWGGRYSTRNSYVGGGNLDLNSKSWIILSIIIL